MAGKPPPQTEKPVPEIESELIVTAIVPLEVIVTDFVTAVPTATLPNDSDVADRVNAGVAAFSCKAKFCDEPFSFAVTVAVCAVLTEATVAVKAAVDAPAGTDTLAGTVTELLLLASDTPRPPVGAGPDKLTVHPSAREPVIELLVQDNALTVGVVVVPVPLKLTVAGVALFEMVSCPVDALAVVG